MILSSSPTSTCCKPEKRVSKSLMSLNFLGGRGVIIILCKSSVVTVCTFRRIEDNEN